MTISLSDTRPQAPGECQPWCAWRNDHPIDDACFSEDLYVDLSLYPAITDHIYADGGQVHGDGADQLQVCGYAATAGADGHVLVAHNSQPGRPFFQVELTPAEALQLIEALQLVLGQIGSVR